MKKLFFVCSTIVVFSFCRGIADETESKSGRIDSSKPLKEWQAESRRKLIDILGISDLMNLPRCNLQPEVLWKRDFPFGSVEKVKLKMEQGVDGLIYICTPRNAKTPYMPFICVEGHSTGMHNSIGIDWRDEKTVLPDNKNQIARDCLKRGIAAVCVEARYLGEFSIRLCQKPACYRPASNALMSGRSAIGERVFDIDRVIDYLATRKDFNLSQVGIIGHSMGGTTAMFAGAVLPRLTHVVISCAVSGFKESIGTYSSCICNYVPNLYLYGDSGDVLGLIAPRPLVVLNGAKDWRLPIKYAKQQMARVKELYRKAGAEKNCQHEISQSGESFLADSLWKHMQPLWKNCKSK